MDVLAKKADKAVKLVQDRGCGYMEAIERVRNCKMDNESQLYDPDTGETFKDIDALTDEELKEFLKYS